MTSTFKWQFSVSVHSFHDFFFTFSSQLAELLYYMEKLRGLMRKYNNVVQRYHVQYLAQFDALVLNDTIQVPERRSMCVNIKQ